MDKLLKECNSKIFDKNGKMGDKTPLANDIQHLVDTTIANISHYESQLDNFIGEMCKRIVELRSKLSGACNFFNENRTISFFSFVFFIKKFSRTGQA